MSFAPAEPVSVPEAAEIEEPATLAQTAAPAPSTSGDVIPIEIKFRRSIRGDDFAGLRSFMTRFPARYGIMVTRSHYEWHSDLRVMCVPLLEFLLAF